MSTWTAAPSAGMTLWCQKWSLDRGSEAAPANLMQTQLNDVAFQEAFHRLLDMKNDLHVSDRITPPN